MTRLPVIDYYKKESGLEQTYFKVLLFMTSWRLFLGHAILQKFLLHCETDVEILFS